MQSLTFTLNIGYNFWFNTKLSVNHIFDLYNEQYWIFEIRKINIRF